MVSTAFLAALAWYMFVVCLVYLLSLVVLFAVMLASAVRENRLRAREGQQEDFDTLLASPFTLPVAARASISRVRGHRRQRRVDRRDTGPAA